MSHVSMTRVHSNLTRLHSLRASNPPRVGWSDAFLHSHNYYVKKKNNMKGLRRIVYNLTLTSVGMGGWYLGKLSEQRRYWKDNETSVLSATKIRNMPGLPLFGTVSAATPLTPAENDHDMGCKMSSTVARVSQVKIKF